METPIGKILVCVECEYARDVDREEGRESCGYRKCMNRKSMHFNQWTRTLSLACQEFKKGREILW